MRWSRPELAAASTACGPARSPRSQSQPKLPSLGLPATSRVDPACAPRETRTPSPRDCSPPPPRWCRPAPRFPSPLPASPARVPAFPAGDGRAIAGGAGPSRGSPDLARRDVANLRGPKLCAQPETQLDPEPGQSRNQAGVRGERARSRRAAHAAQPGRGRSRWARGTGLRGVGAQGVVAEVRAVRFGSMWGPDGGAGLGALRGQPGTIEAARGARSCAKLMVTAAIARRCLT